MLTALTLSLALQAQAEAPHAEELRAALTVATEENRRVLVLLEDTVGERSDDIGRILHGRRLHHEMLYEYGQLRTTPSRHPELAAALPTGSPLPQLLILDASGKLLEHRSWASFVGEEGVDQAAILAMLQEHEATPRDARVWLEQARLQAVAQGKILFVHIGAPW